MTAQASNRPISFLVFESPSCQDHRHMKMVMLSALRTGQYVSSGMNKVVIMLNALVARTNVLSRLPCIAVHLLIPHSSSPSDSVTRLAIFGCMSRFSLSRPTPLTGAKYARFQRVVSTRHRQDAVS